MSWELSMAARREITKKFAGEYAKVGKAEKGRLLDAARGDDGVDS